MAAPCWIQPNTDFTLKSERRQSKRIRQLPPLNYNSESKKKTKCDLKMERTMEMMVQLQQQMATILQQQQGPRITVANYQEGEDIQDFLTTFE